MSVTINVSYGELFDKASILEIKSVQVSDPEKLLNIRAELALLNEVIQRCPVDTAVQQLATELKAVNEKLWHVENRLRDRERDQRFGADFIKLARSVYKLNDQRARIKYELNVQMKSGVIEEKSYQAY